MQIEIVPKGRAKYVLLTDFAKLLVLSLEIAEGGYGFDETPSGQRTRVFLKNYILTVCIF